MVHRYKAWVFSGSFHNLQSKVKFSMLSSNSGRGAIFGTSNPKSKFSMISSKNSLCLPYLCFKIFGKKFVLPVQSLASQMVSTLLCVKTNDDNALMCSSATSRKSKICQYFQTFTNSVITQINAQQ